MKRSPVESYAREVAQRKTDSVRAASVKVTQARVRSLPLAFKDPDAARTLAAAIKDQVLDRLEEYLEQFFSTCRKNGIQIHLAADADEANRIILGICREVAAPGSTIVKAKSMATEEIHLNAKLEAGGYRPVETDLGEFVVQIDGDTPSHIVAPIIHKNRQDIAASFEREGLGPYSEDPPTLAMQARAYLREQFKTAAIGISGVNFGIVETGRIVLVENEGNNRLSTTAPDTHIAVMGIEKLLPSERDLPLFLKLLAGSATGQYLPTYVHLISGPRRGDEVDGPKSVHLVILDNGRRRIREGKYRSVLRCIRCGACQNVCPVFRQGSGHAYGHVYAGPIGAVLAPNLEGLDRYGYLAKASSLCGACEEVCPVKIPIPHMLLELRDEAYRAGLIQDPVNWGQYGWAAKHPTLWRTGLKLVPMAGIAVHPMKSGWTEFHDLPKRRGRAFRNWWGSHEPAKEIDPIAKVATPDVVEPRIRTEIESDLWTQFGERLSELGGRLIELSELDLRDQMCFVDPDAREWMRSVKHGELTDDFWSADVGVTLAECGIMESGSIVTSLEPGRSRMASLAPPVHVVFLRDVVRTVEEGMERMTERTSVVTTGTSRTADIEGVLVRGVHGPRELIVVRLP